MAMGRRKRQRQEELWIATSDIPKSASHPFFQKLNEILREANFDEQVEKLAEPYYAETMGRPSMPPGVYVRMLLVGYFEGIDSERGIAWRCADSLALRSFLGYGLTDRVPDHSTLSGTRRRLPKEFHDAVFSRVIQILGQRELIKGNTLAVDATTMEANAALRSIVRRDTGEQYRDYVKELAKQAGLEEPTAEEVARFDRKRKKKVSNDEWVNPNDPEARITKMKDGRTHLAYKAEHVVDVETGAIVAAEIHPADDGDTTTGPETLDKAGQELADLMDRLEDFDVSRAELVADRGYHSGSWLSELRACGWRTYIAEPDRGRRRWVDRQGHLSSSKEIEREAVYANRRRIRAERGKRLHRGRGEVLERSFAHTMDTGGLRRTGLRGRENVGKRYAVHVAGFNLSVLMRALFGRGKPRYAADLLLRLVFGLLRLVFGELALRHSMKPSLRVQTQRAEVSTF